MLVAVTPSTDTRLPDRRQRKSRAALQQALLALIAAKPYDAITVEDITELADVARATFYAHYRDKAALLLEVSQEVVEELRGARRGQRRPGAAGLHRRRGVHDLPATPPRTATCTALVISGRGRVGRPGRARRRLRAGHRRGADPDGRRARRTSRGSHGRDHDRGTSGPLLHTLERWLGDLPLADANRHAMDFLRAQVGGLEWSLGYQPGESRFERA